MKQLKQILKKLGLSDDFQRLVFGEIKVPILDTFNLVTEYWYPHPPCLIPLFLGYGSSYQGMIHHFFCNRKDTFVEYSLENGYMYESARNEKQLITSMVLDMISVSEEITDGISTFCKEVNFYEVEEVYEFWDEFGDNEENFNNLVHFRNELPFKMIRNLKEYNGDFPSSIFIANPAVISEASPFEIVSMDFLKEIPDVTIWLKKEVNKQELFFQYIQQDKLKEAWFALNSKGWFMQDVAEALNVLKEKSDDEMFHLVADNWIDHWEKSHCDTRLRY